MEILFADDHTLVREALSPVLRGLAETVTIHEAGSLDEALAAYKPSRAPDLILLDLLMPGMDGLRGIGRVKKRFPGAPVVVLSGFYDKRTVLSAIGEGASGFIPKTNTSAALLNALRLVLAGEKYLPSSLLGAEPVPKLSATAGRSIPSDSVLAKLTGREFEILSQLIEGRSNKEIANRLGLQEITTKVHVRNAYRKIGASNRADAVRIAFRHGWD